MIFVLWPTVRPKTAIDMIEKWTSAAVVGGPEFQFWIGINSADHLPVLCNTGLSPNASYSLFTARPGVCDTTTHMTQGLIEYPDNLSDDDIVVLASDDFEASTGWNSHLEEQFKDFRGVLIPKDGYKFPVNILPIPIMSGAYLRRLNGIIYSPFFNHFFSDQELHDIVHEMGDVKNLRGTSSPLFSHKHWSFGGRQRDEFDLRNDKWWDEDKATYESRKSLPIAEKLKLPDWWIK